jgi:hypothetical protein
MFEVFSAAAPQVPQANRDVHDEMDTLQSIISFEILVMRFHLNRQPTEFFSRF